MQLLLHYKLDKQGGILQTALQQIANLDW